VPGAFPRLFSVNSLDRHKGNVVSTLIIGNSPSVLHTEIGRIIDSFPGKVVRLNRSQVTGYERFVGSHISEWFCRPVIGSVPIDLLYYRSGYITVVSDTSPTQTAALAKVNLGLSEGSYSILPSKQITGSLRASELSTGLLAILHFYNQKDGPVYIHGFDFYTDFPSQYFNTDHSPGTHNWRFERMMVEGMIERGEVFLLNDKYY
jgi:hypothetical protein